LQVVQDFCDAHDITLTIAQPTPNQPHVAGHHPTNVAVALQVARLLGIDQNIARDSISTASVEPRALTMLVLEVTDGPELGLIDLGGANDPQSAYEALRALGLNEEGVIPLLVNRWERPLRSLVFMAAVLGRFETVGVVGPLGVWTTSFHRRSPQNSHQAHHQSTVVKITRAMARKPRLLAQRLLAESDIEPGSKVTLVLMENTHDSTADQLRTTFARQGREISLSDWLVPV
jgi:gamma-polyglutamate synthase